MTGPAERLGNDFRRRAFLRLRVAARNGPLDRTLGQEARDFRPHLGRVAVCSRFESPRRPRAARARGAAPRALLEARRAQCAGETARGRRLDRRPARPDGRLPRSSSPHCAAHRQRPEHRDRRAGSNGPATSLDRRSGRAGEMPDGGSGARESARRTTERERASSPGAARDRARSPRPCRAIAHHMLRAPNSRGRRAVRRSALSAPALERRRRCD